MPSRLPLRTLPAVAALFLGASTAAAQTSWNLADQSGGGACSFTNNGGSGIGNQYNCASQPNGATPTLRDFCGRHGLGDVVERVPRWAA